MIQINSQELSALVNLKGAELTSLKKTISNREYIWQADPNYWPRHAPILFPIVGKLRNDEYLYEGKKYSLSQHGFARDQTFELIENEENRVVLSLQDSPESRLIYPFKFKLEVHYFIDGKTLISQLFVTNTGQKKLPFSIGIHPGFALDTDNILEREKYSIVFEKNESSPRFTLKKGLRDGKFASFFKSREIPLTKGIFDQDALIFKNINSSTVSLHFSGEKLLSLKAQNWPWYGIWSKSDMSPFICLEPWHGVADEIEFKGDITSKEGIKLLNPNENFSCQYEIQID